MVSLEALTFRLQGCAVTLDKAAIRDGLAQAFGDVHPDEIRIQSLATALRPWETPQTKTATLSFAKVPSVIKAQIKKGEWKIEGHGFDGTFILDTHFDGLTPLNDVEAPGHAYDCIAISGLASHPFGSWQPKDVADRRWMWIRDALPEAFPTMRVVLFGYDTKLVGSNSFQTISDLASSLAGALKASGFTSPTTKPLIFLAHSLGGIVLKEALCGEPQIAQNTRGAVLFGAPFRGMETRALMTMVRGQANEGLIRDLTMPSEYLESLNDRFFEVVMHGRMKLFWAFETRTSRTVAQQNDGSFARTGSEEVLVTQKSATRGLYNTNSTSTFAINEDHSDMVKFRKGDPNCDVVVGKLKEICGAYEVDEGPPDVQVESSRKIAILKTLYTSPYRDRKDRNPDRVVGTCEWFVAHELFRQWRETNSSTMLWVSADPGCGKSVLAKYLVDHQLPTTKSRTTCYFFFKDDFEDQKSAKSALCCILHQLFEKREVLLSRKIAERFETYEERLTDSFAELWDLLVMVSQDKNAGEIVCILDALDECKDEALAQVLCKFFSAKNNSKLKFLLTSRPLAKLRQEFEPLNTIGLPVIYLKGESDVEVEKIASEINIYIHARVQNIQAKFLLKTSDAELLLQRLLEIPHRTYLWVYLTLDLIQGDINRASIDEATSHLPQTVDKAYEKILAKSKDKKEAKKLLRIVVAAARPLTIAEMSIALTLRESHQSYKDIDGELRSEEGFREYVRDLCGLFVTIISSKIYLLHQTAREFLVQDGSTNNLKDNNPPEWKSSLQLQESHHTLWQISTRYLLLREFETQPLDDIGKLSQYVCDYVFLDYSAKHWATHFRLSGVESDKAITESLLGICDANSARCLTWFGIYWASTHADFPKKFTTLMIASYFGLGQFVELLLKEEFHDINSKDGAYERSALSWASENGFDDVVEQLIRGPRLRFIDIAKLSFSRGAEIEAKDRYGRTPLSYAALNGHVAVASMLVKAGARADSKDKIGGTPISYAICSGKEAVTSLLQKKGTTVSSVDDIIRRLLLSAASKGDEVAVKQLLATGKVEVNVKDNIGRTPLSWAAEKGYEAVVKQLLATGKAEVIAKDNFGQTPLSWAAEKGHEGVIKQLLATGKVEVDAEDNGGRTPLLWAAVGGHEAVVKQLLATGNAEVDAKDKGGRTPLLTAAEKGHKAVVEQLLVTGKADVNAKNNDGWTPLLWAAKKGYNAVVKQLLVIEKVEVDVKDNDGRTPLLWAAESGHDAVLKQLLATGKAEVNTKDDPFGQTPLLWAAERGHEAVAEQLLATGKADFDARGKNGRTPLLWAAEKGHKAIVNQLLATGKVEVDAKNNDGWTPLLWTTKDGYEAAVKQLLATGRVEVNAKNNDGRTPLSWAAENGHKAIFELLLAIGKVEVDAKNNEGRTPLSWAAQNGNKTIVELLLATGKVEVDAKNNEGRTPLSWAAQNGHKTIVELLLVTGKVEVDVKDKNNRTPLSWAATNGHSAIVEQLLATKKVEVNMKDNFGQTPLSWAAEKGHEAVIKQLLATGKVEVNVKDNIGRTPLSWAAKEGHEAVIKQLLATGKVEVNVKDNRGRTPLSWAAKNGYEAVVKQLLATGKVEVDAEDNNGRTPLSWAAGGGHEAVIRQLLVTGKADVNFRNHRTQNPLSFATDSVAKLLISYGADRQTILPHPH